MLISVCSRCKPLKEGLFRQKFVIDELKAGLAIDVQVQEVRRLAACDQPISVGISELGKASYLFGAVIVVSSDIVSRLILAPQELPIGIITAAVGAVFVIFLVIRKRSA